MKTSERLLASVIHYQMQQQLAAAAAANVCELKFSDRDWGFCLFVCFFAFPTQHSSVFQRKQETEGSQIQEAES